ncbi:hypothetical protein OV079_43410 [Nannocystis pusilla]|uniref:Uncharacterized protein n=1 Tax=Nannocystis pusilla TaxID=889268 RepID=A0A9X3EXP8_9BACT|nr:hypothetical protein [Nannocystis pusilla]MCY1012272.1 hypothetical protein [Nannocystis pusilla]
MLTEFFVAASLLAASAASPVPATPDEFLDRVQAPVDFSADAVTAAVDLSEGVHIDIAYELAGVGHVRLAAHGELDGQAAVILLVDDTIILDFGGEWTELPEQAWKAFNNDYLATLEYEEAVALFNSLVQVWTTTEVEQALADAAEAAPPRSVICDVAGALSAGTIGELPEPAAGGSPRSLVRAKASRLALAATSSATSRTNAKARRTDAPQGTAATPAIRFLADPGVLGARDVHAALVAELRGLYLPDLRARPSCGRQRHRLHVVASCAAGLRPQRGLERHLRARLSTSASATEQATPSGLNRTPSIRRARPRHASRSGPATAAPGTGSTPA